MKAQPDTIIESPHDPFGPVGTLPADIQIPNLHQQK
jgi:hypothetical protein